MGCGFQGNVENYLTRFNYQSYGREGLTLVEQFDQSLSPWMGDTHYMNK
jgi:hypothetical protein